MSKVVIGMTDGKFNLVGNDTSDRRLVILDVKELAGQPRLRMTAFSEVETDEGLAFQEVPLKKWYVDAYERHGNRHLYYTYTNKWKAAAKAAAFDKAQWRVHKKEVENPNSFFQISGKSNGYRDEVLQNTLHLFHKQLGNTTPATLMETWEVFGGRNTYLVDLPEPTIGDWVSGETWIPITHPDQSEHYRKLVPDRLDKRPYRFNKLRGKAKKAAEEMAALLV